MWIITIYTGKEDETGSSPVSYRLMGGSEYTLGRKGCIIPLPVDDPSISRHHATLIVTATPAMQLNRPTSYFPKIHVIDFSKHGTMVNGVTVPPMTKKDSAKAGATIIFGRSVMGVLQYCPIVAYISRTVHPHTVEQLKVQVAQLCGFVTEAGDSTGNIDMQHAVWTQQELRDAGVSPMALLYIAEGLAPEKGLVAALLERFCLVSPSYIASLTRVVKDTPAVPLSSLPPPSSCEAPRDAELESLPYRRPEPQMFEPFEFSRAAALNPSAQFRTMHFLFLEGDSYKLYCDTIRRGGGVATLLTPYDVMAWYEQNHAIIAAASQQSLMSQSFAKSNTSSSSGFGSGGGAAQQQQPVVADSVFPLRLLLHDRDAHGSNTYLVASPRAYIATLELLNIGIQEGIAAGAIRDKNGRRVSNSLRTIVALPPPSGTVADALALLYLKCKVPFVRDSNILYALYSEDAATFIAGHTAINSPTNRDLGAAEALHLEFEDPQIAATALRVELDEAANAGLLHAPKRHVVGSSAQTPERTKDPVSLLSQERSGGVLRTGDLSGRASQQQQRGDSPASSVSTVDGAAPYDPLRAAAAAAAAAASTSAMKRGGGSGDGTRSPERRITFNDQSDEDLERHGYSSAAAAGAATSRAAASDGTNRSPTRLGDQANMLRQMTSSSSFNTRQKQVCCTPERLYPQPALSPGKDRAANAKHKAAAAAAARQQQPVARAAPDSNGDALYAKWSSFYEASRTSDNTRTQMMLERHQVAHTVAGRRSPVLAATSGHHSGTVRSGGGGAAVINVGHAPPQLSSTYNPRRSVSPAPFAVSQASRRGMSPVMIPHRRMANAADLTTPTSAPFAARMLRASSPSTPRLLMQVSASNVDQRLLQYCHELRTHCLPDIESQVLQATALRDRNRSDGMHQEQERGDGRMLEFQPQQRSRHALPLPNCDVLKQRVMRYLLDVDLLLSESRRLGRTGPSVARAGSTSRRSQSPLVTKAQDEAAKFASDCKSRLSILLTVIDGELSNPGSTSTEDVWQQQQQQQHEHKYQRAAPSAAGSATGAQMATSPRHLSREEQNAMRSLERHNSNGQQLRYQNQQLQSAVQASSAYTSQQDAQQRLISHPRAKSPGIPFSASLLPKKRMNEL